jgi:3-oxoacyl-[acyl-carrier protein] reductase
MTLTGQVAIVTGASSGIGKQVAIELGRRGAAVVIAARTVEQHGRLPGTIGETVGLIESAGGQALAIRADMASADDLERLVAETRDAFGRIDILVNNAGVMVTKGVLETTEDDWDRTIDVNLKGAYLCSKAVAPIMIEQQTGTIINISSNSGLYHPSAMRFTEYVTSKAGMNGLTKALALALGPYVTVNAICPGWIRTDMMEDIDPEVHERILAETALARWGTPEDVAASAAFLASPDASFVTGELLIVAGGRGMH